MSPMHRYEWKLSTTLSGCTDDGNQASAARESTSRFPSLNERSNITGVWQGNEIHHQDVLSAMDQVVDS